MPAEMTFFPSDSSEALALLYVQSRDLSGLTPTEIHEMYWEAYYEIRKDYSLKRKTKWFKDQKENG